MPVNERMLELLRKLGTQESGFDVFIDLADAEEAEDCGWVQAQPGGGYLLTDAGRKILAENPN